MCSIRKLTLPTIK